MLTYSARRTTQTLLIVAWSSLMLLADFEAAAQVTDADVQTSFEFTDLDGFTLGTSPRTVSFSEGEAKTIGVIPLYRNGLNSFMTPNGATSAIDFETPAEAVEFYVKQEATDVEGLIGVYDQDLNFLQSIEVTALTNDPFQNIFLEESSLGVPIGRITLSNDSSSTSPQYLVIDDFSFRTVPEPTTLVLLTMGGAALFCLVSSRQKRCSL